jgi:hypothetical protein
MEKNDHNVKVTIYHPSQMFMIFLIPSRQMFGEHLKIDHDEFLFSSSFMEGCHSVLHKLCSWKKQLSMCEVLLACIFGSLAHGITQYYTEGATSYKFIQKKSPLVWKNTTRKNVKECKE